MQKVRKKRKHKRLLELSTFMPVQFYLLCKLMEVKPQAVIYEFMCNTGMEKYGLGDIQRDKAMEYFIHCGDGQHYYTEDDSRKIFKEMEAIGSLFQTKETLN